MIKSAKIGDKELTSTITLLKKFVKDMGDDCAELVNLLSFCVSFPVSEAVVESWGSTISHYYGIKHNSKQPDDDLQQTGTVDKLTYIRLCGPPSGKSSNRRFLKAALHKHFKSDFAKYFVNCESYDSHIKSCDPNFKSK